MNEPTTETGKSLLADPQAALADFSMPPRTEALLRKYVLGIEAEAREQMTYSEAERRGFLRGRSAVLSEIRQRVAKIPHAGHGFIASALVDRNAVLVILDEMEKK